MTVSRHEWASRGARPLPPIYYTPTMPLHLKRWQHEGHLHFITFSCYERRPFLNNDPARILFETTLEILRIRHNFHVYGYVLMPEHVHVLMSEPKIGSVSSTLRVLKGETSRKLKGERDQFWQRRYYDFNVFTQEKFVEKLKYIHRNPVKRELVAKPEDWRWSSFRHWSSGLRGSIEIESHWTFAERERAAAQTSTHSSQSAR